MKTAPLYQLYGEIASGVFNDGIHIESIAERSQLYDWEITPHRHEDFLQILHIESGRGKVLLGNEESPIETPCVIVVPRLLPHGFLFQKNMRGVVMTINHAHFQRLLEFDQALFEQFDRGMQVKFSEHSREWDALTRVIWQLREEFLGSDLWRSNLLVNHLATIFIHLARQIPQLMNPSEKGGRAVVHVMRFKKLLDEHYREHWPISRYAQQLGITHTQLNRVCNELLHKPALEIINARITTEAERDLLYSSLAIKEIAFTLGFQDESYFTRFFKKQKGKSPSEFRATLKDIGRKKPV